MSNKNNANQQPNLKPKNAALAIHKALGVPEKHFDAPEQKWEELEDIFQASANAIVTTGRDVNNALALPGVSLNIENKEDITIAVQGLSKDLNVFAGELATIHQKHEGKTGPIRSQHDVINSMSIFDEYVAFNTKFQSVILPTVLTIMDSVGRACDKVVSELAEPATTETVENVDLTTANATTA